MEAFMSTATQCSYRRVALAAFHGLDFPRCQTPPMPHSMIFIFWGRKLYTLHGLRSFHVYILLLPLIGNFKMPYLWAF